MPGGRHGTRGAHRAAVPPQSCHRLYSQSGAAVSSYMHTEPPICTPGCPGRRGCRPAPIWLFCVPWQAAHARACMPLVRTVRHRPGCRGPSPRDPAPHDDQGEAGGDRIAGALRASLVRASSPGISPPSTWPARSSSAWSPLAGLALLYRRLPHHRARRSSASSRSDQHNQARLGLVTGFLLTRYHPIAGMAYFWLAGCL